MSVVVTRSVRCHFNSPPQHGQRMLVTGTSTGLAAAAAGGASRRWKGSLSGFPAGAFGVGFALAFGKWRGRPSFTPQKLFQLFYFFAQPIIFGLDPSQFLAEGVVFFFQILDLLVVVFRLRPSHPD